MMLLYNDIKFLLTFALTPLVSMTLMAYFVTPSMVLKVKQDFSIAVLSPQFCELRPAECKRLLELSHDDSQVLKRKEFMSYHIIYVRHYLIEFWDRIVFTCFGWLLKVIFFFKMERGKDLWSSYQEKLELITAISNAMIFETIKGTMLTRLWVFFFLGIVITLIESWSPFVDLLLNIFNSEKSYVV